MAYTLETLKAEYQKPNAEDSIRQDLIDYALEDAESVESVIEVLERIDCASCSSPAPIYYHEMSQEIAKRWSEIDEAMNDYKENTGEFWQSKDKDCFRITDYLWFAYEWIASNLAGEIRSKLENTQEAA